MSAPQGTNEWLLDRAGKVGASSIADLMARTKSGYGASRANLMARLLTERLTGQPVEAFTSAAMQWGNDVEPQARSAYEFRQDAVVVETGWVPHPEIKGTGCSPDGLVDADGLVEIKCLMTANHVEMLLGQKPDRKYILQVQHQMGCTGRQWTDLCFFDPRLPFSMQLLTQRIARDESMIKEIEAEVIKFLSELDGKIRSLLEKYDGEPE